MTKLIQAQFIPVLKDWVFLCIRDKNVVLDCGYRLDLVVNGEVIIEIKSVSHFMPIHEAQLLSYLKLSRLKRGLLINFNVALLRDGIKRMQL